MNGVRKRRMFRRRKDFILAVAALAIALIALVRPVPTAHGSAAQAPDNSAQNKDRSGPTAQQQKANASDREATRNIRKSIMADKNLSTYAHNVKVITQDGKVTLRGPVHSQQEKETVESKADAVVGKENVASYLDVVASK
jgi:osmotically-inducible protein OsmY